MSLSRYRQSYRPYIGPMQAQVLKVIARAAASKARNWYNSPKKTYKYRSKERKYESKNSNYSRGSAAPLKSASRKPRKARCHKYKGVKQMSKDICHLKRSVKELKMSDDSSTGTLTYRNIHAGRLLSGVNQQGVTSINCCDTASYELVLSYLKFFDPANPGTLVTADGSSGTYQRNMYFPSVTMKTLFRNNYQTDVNLKVYLCEVRDDTDGTPTTMWSAGIANGTNLTNISELGQYPSDYDVLTDVYKLKVVLNKSLSPGESATISHSVKNIEYDPATKDTHSLSYQKEYKSFFFLPVVSGTLSHDTVQNEQGICAAGVDYRVDYTYIAKYSAGINIKYTHVDLTGLDAFTNGAVQSHQPIPDNTGYSIA